MNQVSVDEYNKEIDNVCGLVLTFFPGVTIDQIKSKRRFRSWTLPRQIIMYLVREYFNYYSLKYIGNYFGGRDHSTVIHALTTIGDLYDSDSKFRFRLEEMKTKIDKETKTVRAYDWVNRSGSL